jgi:hypothetical protein
MTTDDRPTNATTTTEDQSARADGGMLAAIERSAGFQLANRYIWLALGVAAYFIIQLFAMQHFRQRFHENPLTSFIVGFIELSLLTVAIVLALATPAVILRWQRKFAGPQPGFTALGISSALTLAFSAALLVLLTCALWLLPKLRETAPQLPLTLLQRTVLLYCMALFTYNVTMSLRYIARLPWNICGILGVAAHLALGYALTYLSSLYDSLERLNDICYYNALQSLVLALPRLTRNLVYNNIKMPYYGYYVVAFISLAVGTLLLWIPFAEAQRRRETLRFTKSN